MSVFVIIEDDDGSVDVKGVFSTKSAAQDYAILNLPWEDNEEIQWFLKEDKFETDSYGVFLTEEKVQKQEEVMATKAERKANSVIGEWSWLELEDGLLYPIRLLDLVTSHIPNRRRVRAIAAAKGHLYG